ncbi:hypothetical protein PSTT_16660 [Puccinia striiformis]|uniref:Core-binding (CB) domain-containing protein n=1 Tax=Puccinia striiformis TaxID=27350 RepID=A0A2S4UC45_9BASI|nr:hypothetical protein PSTT_16660 [Puccinia striiformis]
MSNFDRACVRRPNVLTFNKFNHFLQDGTELSTPSTTNLHILSAWKESTLLGHNCAVKKYLQFNARRSSTRFRLPLSPCDIEAFCMWAGRNAYTDNKGKINGTSLKKYLVGLKAWHTIHGVPFPEVNRDRLNLILKACGKIDREVSLTPRKPAVKIWHVVFLVNLLSKGSNFDRALADLVLVAFWGMARLAELTYDNGSGDLYFDNSILTSDVTMSPDGVSPRTVMLTVRGAKNGTTRRGSDYTTRRTTEHLVPGEGNTEEAFRSRRYSHLAIWVRCKWATNSSDKKESGGQNPASSLGGGT